MAAAHAACYAMALNATLGNKKASADRTVVTAKISAELGSGDQDPVVASVSNRVRAEGARRRRSSKRWHRKPRRTARSATRIVDRWRSHWTQR